MNKKGFTLIELLAVIVILAIIALIATPAVLNIIEDSKESAAKDSAMVIAKAAETHYVSKVTLQGGYVMPIDLTEDTLKYKGEKPEKGYVEYDEKGNAYLKMYMNGYCVVSDYDNTVVSTKMDSEECTIKKIEPLKLYTDGEAVFFNPVTNSACNDGETGCMRWYAFLDTQNAITVNLLLDRNLLDAAVWNADGGTTPDTINKTLADYAKEHEWKVNSRLLMGSEISELGRKYGETVDNYGTEADTWRPDVQDSYCITTGNDEHYDANTNGPHPLGFLFDNLYTCKAYGCNVQSGTSFGYWLGDYAGDGEAWWFGRVGYFSTTEVIYGRSLRPVVEVSKINLQTNE